MCFYNYIRYIYIYITEILLWKLCCYCSFVLNNLLLLVFELFCDHCYCCYCFRSCVEQCEKSGCVGSKCFQHCKFSSDGKPIDGPWYMQEPLYLRWKQWDCRSDCRYHCMLAREEEREKLGDKPVKYHGKWPFQRVYGIQVFNFIY